MADVNVANKQTFLGGEDYPVKREREIPTAAKQTTSPDEERYDDEPKIKRSFDEIEDLRKVIEDNI